MLNWKLEIKNAKHYQIRNIDLQDFAWKKEWEQQ